mmetsp:Transcript_2395/g.3162  ORF Transcript_2395/g.3162 Transcript_2395/m.3162 type:complete len:123 (+) Transcript_2395:678-1046(+)
MGLALKRGKNWATVKIDWKMKITAQIEKAPEFGVIMVWYFKESSPLVPFPNHDAVPTPYVNTMLIMKNMRLRKFLWLSLGGLAVESRRGDSPPPRTDNFSPLCWLYMVSCIVFARYAQGLLK